MVESPDWSPHSSAGSLGIPVVDHLALYSAGLSSALSRLVPVSTGNSFVWSESEEEEEEHSTAQHEEDPLIELLTESSRLLTQIDDEEDELEKGEAKAASLQGANGVLHQEVETLDRQMASLREQLAEATRQRENANRQLFNNNIELALWPSRASHLRGSVVVDSVAWQGLIDGTPTNDADMKEKLRLERKRRFPKEKRPRFPNAP